MTIETVEIDFVYMIYLKEETTMIKPITLKRKGKIHKWLSGFLAVLMVCQTVSFASALENENPFTAPDLELIQGQENYDLFEGIQYDNVKHKLEVSNHNGFDINTIGKYKIDYVLKPISEAIPPSEAESENSTEDGQTPPVEEDVKPHEDGTIPPANGDVTPPVDETTPPADGDVKPLRAVGMNMETAPQLSAVYFARNVSVVPEKVKCICESKCTEESLNADCPVCGKEGSSSCIAMAEAVLQPFAAPGEKFTLAVGETYYFDLSGVDFPTTDKTTVADMLPDTTFHYTPFTYAGTVSSYSLDQSSNGNMNASDTASANPTERSLFVADYSILQRVRWTNLNDKGLIYGTDYNANNINYTIRITSGGSSTKKPPSADIRPGGLPANNEWDMIVQKSNNTGNTDVKKGLIKNWDAVYSWQQDSATIDGAHRSLRGNEALDQWISAYSYFGDARMYYGYRPVLEIKNPDAMAADAFKTASINFNGGSLGGEGKNNDPAQEEIKIVYTGDSYTAPSTEGFKRPNRFFGKWNTSPDGKGTEYEPGDAVPASVGTLYAMLDSYDLRFYTDEARTNPADLNNLIVPYNEELKLFFKITAVQTNTEITSEVPSAIHFTTGQPAVGRYLDANKAEKSISLYGQNSGTFTLSATVPNEKYYLAHTVPIALSGKVGYAPVIVDFADDTFFYEGNTYETDDIVGGITYINKPVDVTVTNNLSDIKIEKHSDDGSGVRTDVTNLYAPDIAAGRPHTFKGDEVAKYTITYKVTAQDAAGNSVAVRDKNGNAAIERTFYVHGRPKLVNQSPIHLRLSQGFQPMMENDQQTFITANHRHVNADGTIAEHNPPIAATNGLDSKIKDMGGKQYATDGSGNLGNLITTLPTEEGKYEWYYSILMDGGTSIEASRTVYLHGSPEIEIPALVGAKPQPADSTLEFIDYMALNVWGHEQVKLKPLKHVNEDGSISAYDRRNIVVYDIRGNEIANGGGSKDIAAAVNVTAGGVTADLYISDGLADLAALENKAGTCELQLTMVDTLDNFGASGLTGWEENKSYLSQGNTLKMRFKISIFAADAAPIFAGKERNEMNFVVGDSTRFEEKQNAETDGSTITLRGKHYKAAENGAVSLSDMLKNGTASKLHDPDVHRFEDAKFETMRKKAENMLYDNLEIMSIATGGVMVNAENMFLKPGKYEVTYRAYDVSIVAQGASKGAAGNITDTETVDGQNYIITLHKADRDPVTQTYEVYVHADMRYQMAGGLKPETFGLHIPQAPLHTSMEFQGFYMNEKTNQEVVVPVAVMNHDISTAPKADPLVYSVQHPIRSSLPTLRDPLVRYKFTAFVNRVPELVYTVGGVEALQFPTSRRFLAGADVDLLEGVDARQDKYKYFEEKDPYKEHTTATWAEKQKVAVEVYEGSVVSSDAKIENPSAYTQDTVGIKTLLYSGLDPDQRPYHNIADGINRRSIGVTAAFDKMTIAFGDKVTDNGSGDAVMQIQGNKTEAELIAMLEAKATAWYAEAPDAAENVLDITYDYDRGHETVKVTATNQYGISMSRVVSLDKLSKLVIRLSDSATMQPVAGGKIALTKTNAGSSEAFVADADGQVTVFKSAGTYTIAVSADGYHSVTKTETVEADTTFILNIDLTKPSTGGGGGGGGSSYRAYDIKISKEGKGVISPNGGGDNIEEVRELKDITFTFTSDKGYEVKDVLIDGKSVGSVKKYTFESVKKDHELKVIFAEPGITEPQPSIQLEKESHFAYITGYADGTFAPDRNISRAETAVMLSRLLKEKMVDGKTYPTAFTDMKGVEWYANEVGYLAQLGIISGYEDGSFGGDNPITRAEFVAITSKFDRLSPGSGVSFTDVSASNWAKDYILSAAVKGWVSGYPDGTFKPTQNITRAEAVSMVNKILGRTADETYIAEHQNHMRVFVDVPNTHWAYFSIMEASSGHKYKMDGSKETWTGLN